jgi:hypothetical protein
MGDIINSLKDKLSSSFASADVFKDNEGFQTYNDFKGELPENEVEEKWSKEYKDSIDCNNPKGFSQRAHCQGKAKKKENKESTGAASAGGYSAPLFSTTKGDIVNKNVSKVETKEATGAASAGQYTTTAAWAKSTDKKHWRGKSKTQIPGGKFVTIKKKCKTFPYCNQGDIKALKIYENEVVKKVITKISKEHNISENVIKTIIQYEIENYKHKPSI